MTLALLLVWWFLCPITWPREWMLGLISTLSFRNLTSLITSFSFRSIFSTIWSKCQLLCSLSTDDGTWDQGKFYRSWLNSHSLPVYHSLSETMTIATKVILQSNLGDPRRWCCLRVIITSPSETPITHQPPNSIQVVEGRQIMFLHCDITRIKPDDMFYTGAYESQN